MNFEDSRNAIYCDPNAFIQKQPQKEDDKKRKKIVFQEPYESMPAFYINNNFHKHNCDCVPKPHKEDKSNLHYWCDCGKQHKHSQGCKCNDNNKNINNCNNPVATAKGFGFDLKSLLPMLGMLGGSGGGDLSKLVGLFNNPQSGTSGGGNLISSLLSNNDAFGGILNLFKGGKNSDSNAKKNLNKDIKSTDFEIKNYTKVE